ncbi:coiled-coil domain-containing protein 157-like isoform X2 [Cyanistes caeruleus]|uniref:coiled-coil domain-containing protein 157-like isoform X2 n=1 Tax=Cyanistes caeruleus TaxID=156563 RepID=UPI000CDA9275|nr:coiled-coil domain-containing protein 157-like isoform X2 [Cyanistes caeruleus]
MQELLDTLQQEKLALEQSILELQANTSQLQEQAQELRERERLLVFFPDLHIPTEMQFESSGNLTEDMESQLQANTIRIEVLERENAQLEALLAKLVPEAQLGSQLHREAGRQNPGRLSSGSSRDSTGTPGCTDKAWHGAASSHNSKQLQAEPTSQAKPCLTLSVRRLGLGPPSHHTGAHHK